MGWYTLPSGSPMFCGAGAAGFSAEGAIAAVFFTGIAFETGLTACLVFLAGTGFAFVAVLAAVFAVFLAEGLAAAFFAGTGFTFAACLAAGFAGFLTADLAAVFFAGTGFAFEAGFAAGLAVFLAAGLAAVFFAGTGFAFAAAPLFDAFFFAATFFTISVPF